MKNVLIRLLPFLFFAFIFLVLFYKVFFFGYVFYEGDNFHLNIPEKYFYVSQILKGNIPFWNPYLFLGIPNLADFNLGGFNFTNVIYFLFSVPRALTLLAVGDLFGCAVGTYLLLRQFSLSKIPALLGGVIFSLGGIPFVLFSNVTVLNVIVYIPFLFLILFLVEKKRTLKYFLLLCFVQFLQFIAGHPQPTYYTMLFISFYFLLFSQFSVKRRIVLTFFYILIPVLLSSIQLFPFLEYVLQGNRPLSSVAYANWGSLTISRLTTFIFPTFYGSHLDGTWWGTQQILIGFIGVPTLFFLYISIRFAKFRHKFYFIFGLVLSLLLSFGKLTPLAFLFYYLVPGWKFFRAPEGMLMYYTFFAALLAAFGLAYYQKNPKSGKQLGKIFFIPSSVVLIVSASMFVIANKNNFWQNTLFVLSNRIHFHAFQTLLFYSGSKLQSIFQGILTNSIYVSLFLVVTTILFLFFSKRRYTPFLFLILTTIGFLLINPKDILLSSESLYTQREVFPTTLRSTAIGAYRLISIPVDFHQNKKYLPPSDFFLHEAKTNISIYQFDNNLEQGVYQGNGYISLVPKSYSTFIAGETDSNNITGIDFSHVTQEKLNRASIRYITSYEPIKNYNNISLRLISQQRNQYVYENPSALSRGYLLKDPYGNHVVLQSSSTNSMSFKVSSTKQDSLIITNWFYPGWVAYVNKAKVPIRPFMNTFQKIAIPSGQSQVRLIYQPTIFIFGGIVTAISILGMLVSFLFFRKKKL